MTYKIKLKKTKNQNKSTVRQLEKFRFKNRKDAVFYKDEFVKKHGKVVKI